MQTNLSGIMNLKHEEAQDIEDEVIEIPVNVGIIQHQEFGAYLIDAGLDKSYVHNPHGTIRGLMVKSYLGKGSQEPNTHIAAILNQESIQLKGVFLTHLHTDHTAGIVDLPKDIPYVAGKNERYVNFRFFMQSDHLAGIDELHEIDFAEGIDLPPLGKAVDIFGDGSLWAVSSSGHSAGHMTFLINGIDEQVLFTGDACNDHHQFESGIGPGFYSSDLEGGQEALERIILFKERYPEVKLVYGHDLKTH
jgi:glyoxylase-like metal-dependent hydrolase (beta-lactamase superfamily II)